MINLKGFTLVEVLIGLFLLSFILLGLNAAQIMAVRETKAARYADIAAEQVNGIVARLMVMRGVRQDEQVRRWNEDNATLLPHGRGIVRGEYPDYDVSVFWGGFSAVDCLENKVGVEGCLHAAVSL